MTEPLGAAASIVGIVGFGLQLATTIQTYIESGLEGTERFRHIAFEISSTASALSQLQVILEAEKVTDDVYQGLKVLKDEGIKQIEVIAAQCDQLYKSIVLLCLKAGAGAWKGKQLTSTLDLREFTASSLTGNLKLPWLEPRMKRCQKKLRWLQMNLLFYLQVVSLARLQIQYAGRLPGSFDEELAQRVITEGLRQRTGKYTKKLALKFKKIDETRSVSDVEAVASLCSAPGDLSENAKPDLEAEEEMNEVPMKCTSGSIGQHAPPENSKRLWSNSNVSGISAYRSSDEEKAPPPFDDGPETGSDNKETSLVDIKEIPEPVMEFQASVTLTGDKEATNPHPTTVEDEANWGFKIDEKLVIEEQTVKDKTWTPTPARSAVDTLQDTLSAKPPSTAQTEVFKNSQDKSVTEEEKNIGIPPFPLSKPQTSLFPSWLKRLFGNRDKFLHDWDSKVLEAFVVHQDSPTPVRLPFGHQRLTFGLKQVMKKDSYLSWDQYLLLESQHHRAIDQIIADAKQSDSRQRTFLALAKEQGHGQDGDRILVFFSLGDIAEAASLTNTMVRKLGFPFGRNHTSELRTRIVEAELAKLRAEVDKTANAAGEDKINKKKAIKFKDAVGRRFSFPFHICKTWAGMEELIRQAFLHVAIIGPHVAEGHYDLVGPSGEIILPQVWESMIEPHWAVTMHMWPMPELPQAAPDNAHFIDGPPGGPSRLGARRRDRGDFPPPPPAGRRGPPPPPPGWIGPPPNNAIGVDAPPTQRRRVPPPPPPGWIGPPPGERLGGKAELEEIIVIDGGPHAPKSSKKKTSDRRNNRQIYDSSDSDGSDSESDILVSDSEIDDDGLDEELRTGINFEEEEEKAERSLGELLGMWTNATDTSHKIISEIIKEELSDSDNDTGSDSGSNSLADD